MRSSPRGLSREEAELWARVAATVKPLAGRPVPARKVEVPPPQDGGAVAPPAPPSKQLAAPKAAPGAPGAAPRRAAEVARPPARPLDRHGLDSSWERKLAKAALAPDFTLDLHGHTLDSAHTRLDHGLAQALAQDARLLLLITGRPRPADELGARGERRGAIRAKVLDWLAAGPHAHRIAAVRQAHPRHGGAGALYIVLRRAR